jgi:urease alpha subunit
MTSKMAEAAIHSVSTSMSYDLVVRGGTVVTASDSFAADLGVRAGRVAAMGAALEPSTVEIPDRLRTELARAPAALRRCLRRPRSC